MGHCFRCRDTAVWSGNELFSLINVSENDIDIKLDNGNTVFLKPKEEIKNVEVSLDNTRMLKVEYDLSEINPVSEGKQRLCG